MKRIYDRSGTWNVQLELDCRFHVVRVPKLTLPRARRAPSKKSMTPTSPEHHYRESSGTTDDLVFSPRNMKNMPKDTRAIPISVHR